MERSPAPAVLGVAFVAVATIWGFNYLFVRAGLGWADPWWLAFLRAGLGAAGAATLLALVRPPREPFTRRDRIDALLLGLPNTTLFYGLWFVAAGAVLPGQTAVIVYSFPLWVALIAGPLSGRPLAGSSWLALAGGFAGVVLVTEVWTISRPFPLVAAGELVAAAVSWAAGTVLLQRRFHPPQLLEANVYQLTGGALGLAAGAAVFAPTRVPAFSLPLGEDVLWLGLVGTGVAYTLWSYLLGRLPVARLTTFTFLVPVVALVASIAVLGERLGPPQYVGVALVVLSIATVARGRRSGPA